MGLSATEFVGVFLFAWVLWAVLFWGAIAVIERHNPHNTFGWALVCSTGQLAASLVIGQAGLLGIVLLLAWFVALVRVLLTRYELGLLHSIGVVIAVIVGPYFVSGWLVSLVGASETGFVIMLYAVPIAILVAWRFLRRRALATLEAAVGPALPEARARRARKRAPSAPIAPVQGAPASAAAPTAAAPAAAPAAPRPALIAPPAPAAPRADGEPSLLR